MQIQRLPHYKSKFILWRWINAWIELINSVLKILTLGLLYISVYPEAFGIEVMYQLDIEEK